MTRAIRFYETGGPEVLKLETVELGEPGPGEARVRHSHIAVNFIDIYFRTGFYPAQLPSGLGSDAVGVVEAVGAGVEGIRPGNRVGYLLGPQGAYSEARVMPADVLIPIPDGVSDSTAATVIMKGMTAQYLFRQVYPLKAGDTFLYHAAAGGVGDLEGRAVVGFDPFARHIGAGAQQAGVGQSCGKAFLDILHVILPMAGPAGGGQALAV